MNIQNLKEALSVIEQLRSVEELPAAISQSLFTTGAKYYIRTVTHHQVGECVGVETVGNTPFVVLKNASWVADSGRWNEALTKGLVASNCEVEPCPGFVRVNVTSIIDVFDWSHDLPKEVK
jgi:hypothetical protein